MATIVITKRIVKPVSFRRQSSKQHELLQTSSKMIR